MTYHEGDVVYPADLPRRFPCKVLQAEWLTMENGSTQVLRLAPLTGPWPDGTVLVRLCEAVQPVVPREAWQMAPTESLPKRSTPSIAA
ncbi:MAG TPA: hypothetical protein VGK30_00680 [Candidatus Binatia bacterium]|jgi:hypothetical protein